jgi:ABC-type polysaccharide/polyol phosphate transport system ATPase subunit
MATPAAIDVSHVTKVYRRYSQRRQFSTLKSALLSRTMVRNLAPDESFLALSDVSFTVPAGATYGVIGRNGSGKSTALKVVAGITKPNAGTVRVDGRVSALIELGAGFHPEISGRENVFINGIMLGLSKREVAKRFDEIVEFAELQDFIDAPVKTYSSGMYMRLGFAVAIHVDPDVLLVDEVLAVGDEGFTHKCLDKFAEFRRKGKTILLVTHSLNLVERFCDEALWLDAGTARLAGDPRRVVGAYITSVERGEEQQLAAANARAIEAARQPPGPGPGDVAANVPPPGGPAPQDGFRESAGRWGSRELEITAVSLLGEDGQASHLFHTGEQVTVRLEVRAASPVSDFAFGIAIFNADGICCYGTNTALEEFTSDRVHGTGHVSFVIEGLDLTEGSYTLDVAAHRRDGYPYDYHRQLHAFRVRSRTKDVGIYRPRHRWEFSPEVRIRPSTS